MSLGDERPTRTFVRDGINSCSVHLAAVVVDGDCLWGKVVFCVLACKRGAGESSLPLWWMPHRLSSIALTIIELLAVQNVGRINNISLISSFSFSRIPLLCHPCRVSGVDRSCAFSIGNRSLSITPTFRMSTSSKKRSAVSAADDEHNGIQYFLLKSEPADYSIDDMKRDRREEWDGIRNFQARNILRSMKVGDRAFFYHSQTKVPGIVGTVQIMRTTAPDPTAYDTQSKYYDEKSTKENCRWDSVLVEYEQTFPIVLTLKELKDVVSLNPDGALANMALFKQTRLSVVPMSSEQWEEVMTMIHNKSRDEGHDMLESNEGNNSKKKRKDDDK